uniref:Uncharacterized protein n=1 Tax=Cynoglossus semilaevis TaxID=244447 RepID=A0A3P8VBY0_CYNSE
CVLRCVTLGNQGSSPCGAVLMNEPWRLAGSTFTYTQTSSASKPITLKAKSLWDKSGAVVMAVRRPG